MAAVPAVTRESKAVTDSQASAQAGVKDLTAGLSGLRSYKHSGQQCRQQSLPMPASDTSADARRGGGGGAPGGAGFFPS